MYDHFHVNIPQIFKKYYYSWKTVGVGSNKPNLQPSLDISPVEFPFRDKELHEWRIHSWYTWMYFREGSQRHQGVLIGLLLSYVIVYWNYFILLLVQVLWFCLN